MDKVTSRGLSALSLLLIGSVAVAQTAAPAAPAAPPKVAPEMDQMKMFVGKWKCEGKAFATPMTGPEHTFQAMAEGKPDSGGHFQAFSYEEKKSKEHRALKVHGLWGWDAGNKRFVRAAVDDNGGWDTATSPGLQADKMLWTGELSGPMGKLPFHHTFTKKGDKEWSYALEIKTPDGKWAPFSEVTCKR